MDIRVKVDGLKELRRTLGKFDQDGIKELAQTPVLAAASVIATQVRAQAPRDPNRRKGVILAESIRVVTGDQVQGKDRRKIGLNKKRAQAIVYPTDFTALFIEYGWTHAGDQSEVPARPFFRPAFESTKEKAQAVAIQGLRAAIEREASKV